MVQKIARTEVAVISDFPGPVLGYDGHFAPGAAQGKQHDGIRAPDGAGTG